MSYSFYLDGTLYNNPAKDKELSSRIRRNSNLNGLLVTQEAKVVFQGDAYNYLFQVFFDGLCTEVGVQIYEDCDGGSNQIYDGVIKIADIKVDFQQCSITTSIEDTDFFSYINNNKSIKVNLVNGTQTKTGEPLASLDQWKVGVFRPCDGFIFPPQVAFWRVYEVMNYMLSYITDNRVSLQSDLLTGNAGENELFMTMGYILRLGLPSITDDYELSFKKLYDAINRIYNVAFVIEGSVMRIEKQDYFYSTEGSYVMTDVNKLEISADNKSIYSTVNLGAGDQEEVTIQGSCNPPANTSEIVTTVESPLYGWGEGEFHLFGQCNEDNRLDLTHDFQIASNVIEDVLWYKSLEFDDDFFLFEADNIDIPTLTADAVRYDFYGSTTPPYYFNMGINNANCLLRQGGYLHNSVQQYLEGGQDQFKVTRDATTYKSNDAGICVTTGLPNPPCDNVFAPLEYNNDTKPGNYNNGGHYDIATFQYTCPSDGDYTFDHTAIFVTFGIVFTQPFPASFMEIFVGFRNLTASTPPIEQSLLINNNAQNTLTGSSSLPCLAGDVIEAYINLRFFSPFGTAPVFGVEFLDTSYFSCTATPTSGGNTQSVNTDQFKALLFKFEYPIDGQEFRDILADPTQLITITSNGQEFKGWIDDLKYNHWENKAQITLRSNAINQDT